jgi:hypothetical protein
MNWVLMPYLWVLRQQPAKLKAWWSVAMEAATIARTEAYATTSLPLSLHFCIVIIVI